MITNQVPNMGQPPNNTHSNQAGSNQSQHIGDLGTNTHVIRSPLTKVGGGATLSGPSASTPAAVGPNQIAGDVPHSGTYSIGAPTVPSSTTGASLTVNNTTHGATAQSTATTSQTPAAPSTWSKFAHQSGPSQPIESTKTLDSFQQFKKQAKEKLDKEKMIEKEQKRREREQLEREQHEREQQERERLTQEQKIVDQEGEIALNSLVRSEQSPVLSPASDSQSPASHAGTGGSSGGAGSNMLRLREQERRKREALASQNQMDLSRQSEIMSKFEDRV